MSDHSDVALDYALRVACLQDAIRQQEHAAAQAAAEAALLAAQRAQDSHTFSFDFTSLFARDGGKSLRYPERFIRVLDVALQRVVMGQDPKYCTDQRFRSSIASFYNVWLDKASQRQITDSKKPEDLIMKFISSAQKVLQKDPELAPGGWKDELEANILVFLDFLVDNLNTLGTATAEIRAHLASIRSNIRADRKRSTVSAPTPGKQPALIVNATSDLVKPEVVQQLLQLDNLAFAKLLESVQHTCTVQAAIDDLKVLLQRLRSDSPVPYGPSDFGDVDQWNTYRSNETKALSELTVEMVKINPPRSDRSDPNAPPAIDSLQLDARPLTFVPPDPRETYKSLVRICLTHDLQVMGSVPDHQDVSLGILSEANLHLLAECARRWRLPQSFCAWTFFAAIEELYEQGDVPLDSVSEAIHGVYLASEDQAVDEWATSDREGLQAVLLRRNAFFLEDIEVALGSPNGYMSPEFQQAVNDWLSLDVTPDEANHPTLKRKQRAICDRLERQAYNHYKEEATEVHAREGGKNLPFIESLATWIESRAKRLNKRFPEGISPQVDILSRILKWYLVMWIRDLEESMANVDKRDVDGALSLYRRAQKLKAMGYAFEVDMSQFTLTTIFGPAVTAWLDDIAIKMRQWSGNALRLDHYEPLSPNSHSSSVNDLFDSFDSAVNFLMDLQWEDDKELLQFATQLAKDISLSIYDYCKALEQAFVADMNQTQIETIQSDRWYEKFKNTVVQLQGDKKLLAMFNFTAASCVKLNNIDAARNKLDKLYQAMHVDEIASPEPVVTSTPQTSLITIKFVYAEGLSHDGSSRLPDAYAIIARQTGGKHLFKTRTIPEATDPRWDETCDIVINSREWFLVKVYNRALKHADLGKGFLYIDTADYRDDISKDVLLPLDTRGHILLRISVEGERDDIQFHFGRAFRWLKRAESDMVRTFVDKMIPVVRHIISRAAIKAVLKPPSSGLDYQRVTTDTISMISQAANRYVRSEYEIPPPPSEVAASNPKPHQSSARGPTPTEIMKPIDPLLDYLEVNSSTLASTLSPDALQMVMAKLWKQILATIEALIVPPLSDKPSTMRPLTDTELDIALLWLQELYDFLFQNGQGVPATTLRNVKYAELLSVRYFYDWKTDALMEECVKAIQRTLRSRALKPSKSIMGQRNLGTIRARKTLKRAAHQTGDQAEIIMKILRMRPEPGTRDFLAQQIQTLNVVKVQSGGKGGKGLKFNR